MLYRKMVLPKKYRRRLATSNMQERLNEEIRRRERVIRIFPNEQSAMRLIGALLAEQQRQGLPEVNILIWRNTSNGRKSILSYLSLRQRR